MIAPAGARKLAPMGHPLCVSYTIECFEKEDAAMNKDLLSYYQVVLADLESEREKLNSMIEATKGRIRSLGGSTNTTTTPTPPKTARKRPAAKPEAATPITLYAGMTIYDAAQKYLASVKQPQTIREVWEALTQGGLPEISYNAVYTALWRRESPKGSFVRAGGEGRLAKWTVEEASQHKGTKPAPNTSEIQPRSRTGFSLMDYCAMLLKEANRPLHAQVLVSKLEEKGVHTSVDSLSSTFRRDSKKRFENRGRNNWALAEWPESVKNQGRKETPLLNEI
jgi:hypothetical protein